MSSENNTNKIAKKSDWGTKPMPDKNTTFTLERVFTDEQMECLKMGNIPQAMEDKWFWYVK